MFADEDAQENRRASFLGPSVGFGLKVLVGGGHFVGFLGAGIGGHFGTLKLTRESGVLIADRSTSELSFDFPVGLAFFLSKESCFAVAYRLVYVNDSPSIDEVAHSVPLGLGMQLY